MFYPIGQIITAFAGTPNKDALALPERQGWFWGYHKLPDGRNLLTFFWATANADGSPVAGFKVGDQVKLKQVESGELPHPHWVLVEEKSQPE